VFGRTAALACFRLSGSLALAFVVSACLSTFAFSADADDSDATTKTPPKLPNIYLDLRTIYTSLPANVLSVGFSPPPALSALSAPSFPASKSLGIDVPLTVDLSDRVSVYGGFSASAVHTDISSWSTMAVNSWNMGIQADVYEQNGGSFPTVTIQSTVTKSVPESPLATTNFNTIVEASYALNEDETRGLLAGIQYTRILVETALATVNPNTIGYVGAFYQWSNNWKLTGRAGIQTFDGAQLPILASIQGFTQPIIRADIDRMDDNDNRLFGVTGVIAWTPKPSYQIIIRTPIFAVRNN
jgi:hypothetical protein